MRTINVEILGCWVKKDSKNAGVMGEGNVTSLHITLDESWQGYGKRIVWRNANGENPVSVALVSQADADSSGLEYSTQIPSEALALPGWCSFTVEGYQETEGVHSVAISVSDHLFVERSDSYYKPAEPTPGETQQIMEAIGKNEGIVQAAAKEAKSWAVGGTASRDGEDTDNAMYYAQEAENSALYAGDAEQAAGESAQSAQESAEAAGTAAAAASRSAQQATAQANAAATSAQHAANFEQASSDYAREAKESMDAASGYASSAQTNAQLAQASASDAAASKTSASQSAQTAVQYAGHAPVIQNGNWYVWDYNSQAYVDTGVVASGASVTAAGMFGFHIDKNGDLILSYTGDDPPPFEINEDGDLVYTLNGNTINLGRVVGGGGTGGTSNYNDLTNKPSINGVQLSGNKTSQELGIPAGEPGQSATIAISSTETVPAGADAAFVELPESTPQNRLYKAQVPQGPQGDTGPQGEQGPAGEGVPPTDDVPTDYLLSVGGWVPPPESGGSAPTCRAWDVTVEEDVISYTIPVDDPTAYDYYIYQVSRPSGWSGNLTVTFVRDSGKVQTNGVQIAKHIMDSGIIIVRPIDKIPFSLSMNYANVNAVIASSPGGSWYASDGSPASIIIKNIGGNVEAGTRIVLRGYQFESI